jgi:hypothetical protein
MAAIGTGDVFSDGLLVAGGAIHSINAWALLPTSHERGLVRICRRLDTCLPSPFRNISTWTVETGLPDNMSSLASKSAWSA